MDNGDNGRNKRGELRQASVTASTFDELILGGAVGESDESGESGESENAGDAQQRSGVVGVELLLLGSSPLELI